MVTGSRDIKDLAQTDTLVWSLLDDAQAKYGTSNLLVVHGDAVGVDALFKKWCEHLGIKQEPWPAWLFPSPLIRNIHMVNLVAGLRDAEGYDVVCWAFAREWKSGTGHCARKARDADILTIDYGVNTKGRGQ